jgi:hypothetical protein
LVRSQGSVTMTLPPGEVILKVAWPSHMTSTLPAAVAAGAAARHAAH